MTATLETFDQPCAWRGSDLRQRPDEWIHRLSAAELAEIDTARRTAEATGKALLDITRADFPLPTMAPVLEDWADRLDSGRGFLLVRGLPVADWTEEQASLVFWGLGRHLGIPVSQNAAGNLLGHVRDTGRSITDPTVRGYQTRAHLPFHTDGSDVVGLLCLRTARSGGRSSVVSSVAIYNEVVRRRPDLADVFFEPFYIDRRGEHRPDEPPYVPLHISRVEGGRLRTFYIRGYIESAQRHPDVPRLTDRQREFFDVVDSVAHDPEFHLDMNFEVGDVQWVSNSVILHSRTEYVDHDEPDRKRHLLRLWLTLFRNARDGQGHGGIAKVG